MSRTSSTGRRGPSRWKNYAIRSTDPRGDQRVVIATGLPEYGFMSSIFDQPNSEDSAACLCSLRNNFYPEEKDLSPIFASVTREEAESLIEGRWRKPTGAVFYVFSEGRGENLGNLAGDPWRSA